MFQIKGEIEDREGFRHPNLLDRKKAVLIVIDMQEPFLREVFERERVIEKTVKLVEAAKILGVPIIATLQYGQRMGDVISEVARALPEVSRIDKRTFSCCGVEPFIARLRELGRRQMVLCGVEAHVCISQTAHDLLAQGYQVHIVRDAVSSRKESDLKAGIRKMEASGAIITSFEMAVFEIMRDSAAPEFKDVLALVK